MSQYHNNGGYGSNPPQQYGGYYPYGSPRRWWCHVWRLTWLVAHNTVPRATMATNKALPRRKEAMDTSKARRHSTAISRYAA
jgi:hypothetical protein